MKAPEDQLGRKICVGDWVAFPGRHSSSLWITVMKVTEIRLEVKDRWYNHNHEETTLIGITAEGKVTRTSVIHRVVILDNPEK